jgi:hypothetical protein
VVVVVVVAGLQMVAAGSRAGSPTDQCSAGEEHRSPATR